jgi:hypothetical protein
MSRADNKPRIRHHGVFRAFSVLNDADRIDPSQADARRKPGQPTATVKQNGGPGQKGTTEPASDVRLSHRTRGA